MRRLKTRFLSCGCLVLVAGCAAVAAPKSKPPPFIPIPPEFETFVPQADGTPLPPSNPDAARNWPSEFKNFIDEALRLFEPGNSEPTLEEFELKLGIKLKPSGWKKTQGDQRIQVYNVEAPWIYRFKSTDPAFWADASTLTELPRPLPSSAYAGHRIYMLSFDFDPTTCISPYDLAIYTGANFNNDDSNPHQLSKAVWANAYEWGMFKRGYYGRYTSNKGFSVVVNARNDGRSTQSDATCITNFSISANFKPR